MISTQVTDPRPKSSPSMDGANEQEAYGVAVSLLVAGLKPDDLETRLQSEGWSPEISAKVSRDLGKLGAGLGRHNKPEAPASKPSPDALNAMLAKRQPQLKKPEQPDPLAAYLKMKKFGVAAEGVLARMQMDGPSPGVHERGTAFAASPSPARRLFRGAQATISKAAQAGACRVRIPGEDGHVADEPRRRRAATRDDRITLGEDGVYEPEEVGLERR